MDDVIVFGRNQCAHDKNLNDVMNRIKNSGLKLNRDKCEFSQNKVKFLGHIISKNGIELNLNEIEAINNLKIPTNVHELRRVLGLFNFVTKFIPKAQENLSPMNELLKKGVCLFHPVCSGNELYMFYL